MEPGGASPPSESVRPRWIGAAAVALVGGLAIAGWVTPASAPQLPEAKQVSAPAPLAAKSSVIPGAPGAEKASLSMDDGVPAPAGIVKAGGCEHGL